MSEWRYELTPLTPLHIAAGDTIEPFEYVIREGWLYKFDAEAFLLALTPQEQNEFVAIAGKDLLKARDFVNARGDVIEQIAEYRVPVSATAAAYYEQRLSNPQSDLSIGVFIRTNCRAYIPGSSLKGALRTALLYAHATTDNRKITERRADLLEAKTFGYARERRDGSKYPFVTDDPFKYFKISDGNVREGMTQLAAVNVHTKHADGWSKAQIPLLREVTWGALTNHSKARAVTTTFAVSVNESITRVVRNERRAKWFDGAQIITACRAFYGEHLKQEAQFHQDNEFYRALQEWEKELPGDACLVRLGWGSGFDAVTMRYAREGAKDISMLRPSRKKRRQDKRSREEGADLTLYTPASRRLVESGAPLGWAELRIVPASEASSIQALEQRLAQIKEIVISEETPTPAIAPRPAPRLESTAPATPATAEEIQALLAARGRERREKHVKPKSVEGEKQKRKLDEIHKRIREQK